MSQPSDLAQGDKPAYAKSMMDYLGDRQPFSVFEETPTALRVAASAVPADKLRTLEAPGKWSVLNVGSIWPMWSWCSDRAIVSSWRRRVRPWRRWTRIGGLPISFRTTTGWKKR